MSHVSLIAADKPLPLCDHREYREKTSGKYTIGIAAGFSVEKHEYYRDAVEELGFEMKPYRYAFDLDNCETDLAHLLAYLRENLSAGEEVELWSLWVGNGPGRLRRYRGTIDEFDMDTLGMLLENEKLLEEGQTCLTVVCDNTEPAGGNKREYQIDWPKSSEELGRLVEERQLFDRAKESLVNYLESCSVEDPARFAEDMRADLETVLQTYHFRHKMVSLHKNYYYDPPEDYLSVTIDIDDNGGDWCCTYRVFFDFDLNVIDDMLGS